MRRLNHAHRIFGANNLRPLGPLLVCWPGNVRELQSAVKHALLQASGPVIVPAYLPEAIRQTTIRPPESSAPTKPNSGLTAMTREWLDSGSDDIHRELIGLAEREILAEVLKRYRGNLSQASKRLGITRATLRTKMAAIKSNPLDNRDHA